MESRPSAPKSWWEWFWSSSAESEKQKNLARTPIEEKKPEVGTTHSMQRALKEEGDPSSDSDSSIRIIQQELEEFKNKYTQEKKKWIDLEIKIIGDESLDNEDFLKSKNELSDIHAESFLTEIYKGIVAYLEPVSENMQQTLEEVEPHLQSFCEHLKAICDKLNNANTEMSKEEKRNLLIDVCNTCIAVLNEQLNFMTNITREISTCLTSERLAEAVTVGLLKGVIEMITRIPLPDYGFIFANFESTYEDYVAKETPDTEIEKINAKVEGMLKIAEKEVDKQKTLESPKLFTPSSPRVPRTPPTTPEVEQRQQVRPH